MFVCVCVYANILNMYIYISTYMFVCVCGCMRINQPFNYALLYCHSLTTF